MPHNCFYIKLKSKRIFVQSRTIRSTQRKTKVISQQRKKEREVEKRKNWNKSKNERNSKWSNQIVKFSWIRTGIVMVFITVDKNYPATSLWPFMKSKKLTVSHVLLFVSISTIFFFENDEFTKEFHEHKCVCCSRRKIAVFMFVELVCLFCCLHFPFQILWCKFLASVNVSGVSNAEPFRAKRFTWKMKLKLPKQSQVSANLL